MTHKRLAEYAKTKFTNPIITLAAIENTEVLLLTFRHGKTKYGDACYIDIVDENGKEFTVITSNPYIIETLEAAAADNAFPCVGKFVRKGRYWSIE